MSLKLSPNEYGANPRGAHVRGYLLQLVAELSREPTPPEPAESVPVELVEMLLERSQEPDRGLENAPTYHETQRHFIEGILRDPRLAEADILLGGQIFGIDLTRPRAVILVDAARYILNDQRASAASEAEEERRAQQVINHIVNYFSLPNDTICADIGQGEIAILKASSSRDLSGWVEPADSSRWGPLSWADLGALKRAADGLLRALQREIRGEITIGIGRYHPGIRGLAHSYQDARAALSIGVHYEGTNRVHCLDRLGIASFVGVADDRTKFDLAAHLLSPLDHAPELLETLEVFFDENCAPSTTSCRLAIHRNTLRYRLDKIASLTGLDPRNFDDAVQIRLALVVRLLRGNSN